MVLVLFRKHSTSATYSTSEMCKFSRHHMTLVHFHIFWHAFKGSKTIEELVEALTISCTWVSSWCHFRWTRRKITWPASPALLLLLRSGDWEPHGTWCQWCDAHQESLVFWRSTWCPATAAPMEPIQSENSKVKVTDAFQSCVLMFGLMGVEPQHFPQCNTAFGSRPVATTSN